MPSHGLGHDNDDDEDYYLAPQDQRAFGAGIKRKRVAFVPASSTSESTPPINREQATDAGARYLSIVLGQQQPQNTSPTISGSAADVSTAAEEPEQSTTMCPVCKQPLTASSRRAHESSIAHQVCLEHSHPPSHLDRQRKGLKYLEGYGWDPDARLGLGARNDGIRMPVKAKEKRDTTGLGLFAKHEGDDDGTKKKTDVKKEEHGHVARLNAKQVRKVEEEKNRKAERLRKAFYSEDLTQYLGPEG